MKSLTINYVIMVLYAANILWSLWCRDWLNAWYWLAALNITMAVTAMRFI